MKIEIDKMIACSSFKHYPTSSSIIQRNVFYRLLEESTQISKTDNLGQIVAATKAIDLLILGVPKYRFFLNTGIRYFTVF